MSKEARLKSTIYIGGLDLAVTPQIIHSAFIPFGDIVDVSLPKPDLPSNKDPHRGFGYVEFESPADAKEAIDNMDQSELFGRVIRVAQAKPSQKDLGFEGLGSKVAVWEQVRPAASVLQLDANNFHRKAGLRSMAPFRRIALLWTREERQRDFLIQCKG